MTKFILLSVSLFILSISLTTIRAAGEVDPAFSSAAQSTNNASVRTIAVQPDGKTLVGGQFAVADKTQRNGIVRFNVDGSVDAGFNPPEFSVLLSAPPNSFDSVVIYAVAVQPDNRILVGGNFARVNNQNQPGLVRLNADGSLDSTFAAPPNLIGTVLDIKLQADHRIVVGNSQGIARLNADGSRDSSLQLAIGGVNSLAVQSDGKIVVNDVENDTINRFNADGTADDTFLPVLIVGVNKIVIQPDGKILLGGAFGASAGSNSSGITRLEAYGSFDTSFDFGGSGTDGTVSNFILLPTGKIVIGGGFSTYNNVARSKVARLNGDGTLDQSFNYLPPTNTTSVYAVAATGDGKVIVGGNDPNLNGSSLSRLNADGAIDATFLRAGVYSRGTVYKVLSQPDGKVLIAGSFNKINGIARQAVARLNADGSIDTGFVPPVLSGVGLTLALQPDGKILVAKSLVSSNPGDTTNVVRLNTDGSLDSSFQFLRSASSSSGTITEIAVQSDGKIIIGGYFTIFNSQTVTSLNLARINADGSEDTTFPRIVTSVDNSGSGLILALKIQPNGKIVIGGRFTRVGSAVRNRIARLNADGTLDETFNQPFGVDNIVYDLALQSDGKIIIGGIFSQVNAVQNFRFIARLFPDATLDTNFNPQSDGAVHSLEVQSDDKIIVGGLFNAIAGASRTNLARLNANGTIDSSFGGTGANDIVFSATASGDGKILVGGQFTRVNKVSAPGIARLLNNTASGRPAFDFDGDGRADVSVFRPSTGYWYTSQNPAINYGATLFGQSGDRLVPADYDGDGKTDVAVNRNGNWYLQRSQFGFVGIQFGDGNDIPVPADYDGDGRADIAVFRPSNGYWYILQSSNNQFIATLFGIASDKPVPADYDGDGKADIAVNRSGTWYIQRSQSGFTGVLFGDGNDKLVPADYDGDGKTDIAVVRNGNWYLNRSNHGFTGIQFGASSDSPIPNAFVR